MKWVKSGCESQHEYTSKVFPIPDLLKVPTKNIYIFQTVLSALIIFASLSFPAYFFLKVSERSSDVRKEIVECKEKMIRFHSRQQIWLPSTSSLVKSFSPVSKKSIENYSPSKAKSVEDGSLGGMDEAISALSGLIGSLKEYQMANGPDSLQKTKAEKCIAEGEEILKLGIEAKSKLDGTEVVVSELASNVNLNIIPVIVISLLALAFGSWNFFVGFKKWELYQIRQEKKDAEKTDEASDEAKD